MPDPPELIYDTVTPAELLQRLDIIRERFRTGLLTVSGFNAVLKAFQFGDDVGHLWAPGATSSKWYRWDMDRWTEASPPARFRVSQSPVIFTDMIEDRDVSWRPAPPATPVEGVPSRPAVRAVPAPAPPPVHTVPPVPPTPAARAVPPPAAPAPRAVPPPAPATDGCPKCGTLNAGKKFCTNCGTKLRN